MKKQALITLMIQPISFNVNNFKKEENRRHDRQVNSTASLYMRKINKHLINTLKSLFCQPTLKRDGKPNPSLPSPKKKKIIL